MNKRIDRMKKGALTPVAMLLFAAMASAQSYYVLNLGVLPGQTDSFAAGINSSGTVVGHSGNNAFAWTLQNCSMTQLGHVVSGRASAAAISNQGKIVGSVTDAPDRQRAFSYDGGVISDLGGPANLNTSATAISSWQIPVGVERIPLSKDLKWAVYYLYDQAHELPSVVANPPFPHPFVQIVTGVNDLLQVTGFLFDSVMNAIGFVSAPNFGSWTRIQGIPGNASQSAVPNAINNDGHIVGHVGAHAFFSTNPNAPAMDLGTLGDPGDRNLISEALGINIHNWVVGFSESSPTSGLLAFVHNGSTMIDLNTRLVNGTGWVLQNATGINDNGLIIGNGTFNQKPRAFLLVPVGYPLDISRCNVVKGPPLF